MAADLIEVSEPMIVGLRSLKGDSLKMIHEQ